MPLRLMFAGALLTLVVVASLLFPACSSSGPRDINYGTDVAVGFEPPDAAFGPEVVPDTSLDSPDLAQGVDGASTVDSSTDEGT